MKMRLYGSNSSPYVRKVRVVALEAGVADQIDFSLVAHDPVSPDLELNRHNPLGKIPALVEPGGRTVFDSRVICEFLDGLGGGFLLPDAGEARLVVQVRQSLADGILDAAVLTRYEQALRPEALRWDTWIAEQLQKVRRALETLAADPVFAASQVDLGTIGAACALGYLDFRFPRENWRATHPVLDSWYSEFSQRDSLRTTQPG